MAEVSKLVPGMHFLDGICLPDLCSAEHLKEVKTLELDSSDVIITGYPRSGNTWTVATIDAILNAGSLDKFEKRGTASLCIGLNVNMSEIKQHASPRVMFSHLRYHMLPEEIHNKNIKLIHITRDPKDVVVSFYHFCKIFKPTSASYEGTWGDFFDAFMEGNVIFGSWFDYTKDWSKHKNGSNILCIEYESFLDDMPGSIRKMAEFLGKSLSDSQVDRIASIVSFKSMKNNPSMNKMDHPTIDPLKGEFIRSGKIGEWRKYFTPEQEVRFNSAQKDC